MSDNPVNENPSSTPGTCTTSGPSIASNVNTSSTACGQMVHVAPTSNQSGMMASGSLSVCSVTSGMNTSFVNTQPIAHTITVGQNSALQLMPSHQQQSHAQQQHSAQFSAAGMAAAMAGVPQNGAAIPPMNMAVAAQMAAAGAPHNHLGQPMQMIPQPLGSPYLPQFSYNQQLMLQNAAAVQAAMQAQALSGQFPMAAMAGTPRPTHVGPKSPSVQGPTVLSPGAAQAGQALAVSVAASCNNNQQAMGTMVYAGTAHKQAFATGKMGDSTPGTPTGQHPQVITGKATMLQRAPPGTGQAQPIVIGQIGVVSGQPSNAGLMAQQCGPDGKPVTSLAQSGAQIHNVLSSQQAQALRLTGQQQLVTNSGQILTSQPMFTNQAVLQAMASLQQSMPLGHQPFVAAQSHGILPGQPLYIRAAGQLQPQAMMTANMQPIGAVKGQRIIDTSAMANMQSKPVTMTTTTSPKPAAQIQGRSFSTILPSTSKPPTSTAKVRPTQITNQSIQGPKLNIPQVISKQAVMKARGRGVHKPGIASGVVVSKTPGLVVARTLSHPKPGTPSAVTTTTSGASSSNSLGGGATKSQSDSEVETSKKSITSSTSQQIQGITSGSSVLHKPVQKLGTVTAKVEPTIKHEVIKKTSHKLVIDTSLPPIVATMNGIDSGDTDRSEESSLDSTAVTEHKKPEAVVKPHILTHYIEGFVIQEGPEPFPVQRSSLLTEFIPPKLSQEPMLTIETEDGLIDNDDDDMMNYDEYSFDTSDDQPPQLSPPAGLDTNGIQMCEYCGKAAMGKRFRRSKRFCSMVCAKRYNVSCQKRFGLQGSRTGLNSLSYKKKHSLFKMKKSWRGGRGGGSVAGLSPGGHGTANPPDLDLEYQSSSPTEMEDTSSSANSPAVQDVDTDMMDMPRAPLAIWTVQDVFDFIQSIAGCGVYAEEFRSQEIDGQALMLLKEDHLMTAMNIKLGPALKICARINALKG